MYRELASVTREIVRGLSFYCSLPDVGKTNSASSGGGREGEGGSELCAKALHRCYVQYVYTIYTRVYIDWNRGVWKEEEGTMEGRLVLYKSLRCKRLRPSFHPCFRSTRAGRGEEGTIRTSSEIRKGIDTFD